jgi:pyruvate dehydrogenase E1 component alpha subunit
VTQSATTFALDPAQAAFYHRLLRQMLLVRRFEEKAAEAYAQGRIGGFCHLYIGQEAVAVGAIAALREDDYIFASYREHAHALVRGMSPRACMAELFGKATGCSKGKGGSMHLFDAARGFLGGHAIVGSHLPLATGAAFAIKYRGTDQVSACFFGEAAANIGAFHESLNMASLWTLPVIFVCENNRYGMGTALERASAVYHVADRACAHEMEAATVDGMDVLAVYDAMRRAVERARRQKTPTLLEMRTYRYMGHSMADPIHGHYRTKEELEEQKARDPIPGLKRRLEEEGLLDEATYQDMEREVADAVADAVAFAESSPDPDLSELYTDVYRE